ncbi:discoidin domain-containing protein [Nocardia sp. NPDC006044]|uniref:discoidin domain-containing protein n=1 Tax=Nocardia sp. NPDC006044 TaxID=3364306 RepID=UPI0036A6EB29
MQTWARGALYSLYSSTNAQQSNSISPVGLGSDNYGGAVFWDADIWMFPGLLQFAPELASSVVQYRYRTLPAAHANAQRLGYPGAFYPWTSASHGDLEECHSWDPPHCLTQIHLQGDISLSAWQFYLATGDKDYLGTRGWPIMKQLAEFWAARVTANADGSFSIDNVAGPDEYSNGVNDAVYTNAVAALALRNAAAAADILGEQRPAEWTMIADHLRMPFDPVREIFLQYDGYPGTSIKQADTTLLIYPLEWPMAQNVSSRVLEYYAERTDPDGPAMTDSAHAIDAAAIGAPGCAVGTYFERAARPFERAPFGQFAEARGSKAGAGDALAGAPAFTFVTAAGGFLQTFTNGLLGLRLRGDSVAVDPILPPDLASGVDIRGVHWQGRVFNAELGPEETTIVLKSGAPMRVQTANGAQMVSRDHPLIVQTRRPDRSSTDNLARCKLVTSSSDESGRYAAAAVDGSGATAWTPTNNEGSLTVDLGGPTEVARIHPSWSGALPTEWAIKTSADNRTWTTVSVDPATGALPSAVVARFVRLVIVATEANSHPGISELEVVGPVR